MKRLGVCDKRSDEDTTTVLTEPWHSCRDYAPNVKLGPSWVRAEVCETCRYWPRERDRTMQARLTDEQIARLTGISVMPVATTNNMAHRCGLVAGALQLAQAMKVDAEREEAVAKINEELGDAWAQTKHQAPSKSAVDAFIDALEMGAGGQSYDSR